ncbi:23S rRNA (uracil(1939)-C(5))-methyltransferase RlmD [Aerococcus christensenii]|uniref:23S rRNA (uracil(1939)-C(5))-methyltransferase RlmD n=1 Tax=Aerococcus christensenii TaxID=87541 RepID=UPI003F42EB0D
MTRKDSVDQKIPVEKNKSYEVEIEDLTYEGLGVAKVDHYSLFIANALPSEKCQVKVLKTLKRYGFAKVEKRYNDAPCRVPLRDEDGLRTGTMPLQHLAYPAQLTFKRQQVINALHKFGLDQGREVLETIGMENPWAYRNKAQVPIAGDEGALYTGFYRQRSHVILPIQNYHIQSQEIDDCLQKVMDVLNHYPISSYKETNHQGLLRYVVVRQGYYTGQLMIILVVNGTQLPQEKKIVEDLTAAVPQVKSIILNQNEKKTNVILGDKQRVFYGQDVYEDQMLGLTFSISSRSFFQVNTPQAERLYQEALKRAELTGKETVIDAYCGIGTISLAIARQAKAVYGVEIVEDAIRMAKENAERNGLTHTHFEAGDAGQVMKQWVSQGIQADVLVVDPPRKGLSDEFKEQVLEVGPQKIIYVSCNPATLARDCAKFVEAGYEMGDVQPVDLFPQTSHVETIVLLSKLDSKKYISVELPMDDMDLTSAESKATYKQIQNYVLEKLGFKVSTLYIAQVKRKYGLKVREHYNIQKNENQKVPQCSIEKEEAILDALKYFKMV